MKRIFIIITILLCGLSVKGQKIDKSTRNGIFADISAGVGAGDYGTQFGAGLKIGYRYHIYNGFSWDILSIGTNSGTQWLFEDYPLRLMTGVHYELPKDIIKKSMYANFALGYSMLWSEDVGGLAYEIGVGFNLSKLISLGLVWEGTSWTREYNHNKYRSNFGIFGARLGFNF